MPSVFERVLELLFPSKCLACGGPSEGKAVCSRCKEELRPVEGDACPFCGRDRAFCRCEEGRDFLFERTVSQWYYTTSGAALIQSYKFRARRAAYDQVLGPAFELRVKKEYGLLGVDWIVPVPMYRGEARRRGFFHAGYIARSLGRAMGLPVREDFLVQVRDKRPQHSLRGRARQENVKGLYRASGQAQGARVLLVDDIATSFATMNACAGALLEAGAGEVLCAAPMTAAPLKDSVTRTDFGRQK